MTAHPWTTLPHTALARSTPPQVAATVDAHEVFHDESSSRGDRRGRDDPAMRKRPAACGPTSWRPIRASPTVT
jgi:hypothetical protein